MRNKGSILILSIVVFVCLLRTGVAGASCGDGMPVSGREMLAGLTGGSGSQIEVSSPERPPAQQIEEPREEEKEKKEEEEKKRVPKPVRKRKKTEPRKEEREEYEENGGLGDCFGTLFVDLVASILCSPFSGEKEHEDEYEYGYEEEREVEIGLREGERADELEEHLATELLWYTGVIEPVDSDVDHVVVWSVPVAFENGGYPVCELPRGAEVDVTARKLLHTVPWVRVRDLELRCATGWVLEENVSGMPESQIDRATEAPKPSVRWQILSSYSWTIFGGKEIVEEYGSGAFRIGGETQLLLTDVVTVGFGVGYCRANGNPKYDYTTPTRKDYPLESTLSILDLGLKVGVFFPLRSFNGYFSSAIGPCAYRVRESARIEFDELEGGSVVGTGLRTDEMMKWRLGIDVNLGVGWVLGGHVPLGFYSRFFWVPWKGHEEESLTLDWLGRKSITGLNIGVGIGYGS